MVLATRGNVYPVNPVGHASRPCRDGCECTRKWVGSTSQSRRCFYNIDMTTKPRIGNLVRVSNIASLYYDRFGIVIGIVTDTEGIYCTVVWCNPRSAEDDRWLGPERPETEIRRDVLEVLS